MYKLRAYVKVIATGVTGRVEQRNQSTGKYWVEFDRNLNSRQWFAESELAGVSRALFFLRCHSAKLFHGAALGIALVLPERLWYPAVLRVSRLQALILRPLIAISPYREDRRRQMIVSWLLNSWLRQLSTLGRSFPIPILTQGEEAILDAGCVPNGTVICSVHLPLVHLILRSLVDINHPPTAVLAGETEVRNGRIPIWGADVELPGVVTDRNVLLKVRKSLRRGGTVVALVDTDSRGFSSS